MNNHKHSLPPEMVNGKSYDEAVDNWTVGILAYELVVGSPPFEQEGQSDEFGLGAAFAGEDNITAIPEMDSSATFRRISTLQYSFPDHVSEDAKDLIRKVSLHSYIHHCRSIGGRPPTCAWRACAHGGMFAVVYSL
jgi:serine/threonine protein kinase